MTIKDLILDRLEVPVSQFCREAGVNRTTMDSILNGNNGYNRKDGKEYRPSLLTIKKICRYFGVDYKDYI